MLLADRIRDRAETYIRRAPQFAYITNRSTEDAIAVILRRPERQPQELSPMPTARRGKLHRPLQEASRSA